MNYSFNQQIIQSIRENKAIAVIDASVKSRKMGGLKIIIKIKMFTYYSTEWALINKTTKILPSISSVQLLFRFEHLLSWYNAT